MHTLIGKVVLKFLNTMNLNVLLRDVTELAIVRGKDITLDYEVLELIKGEFWEINTIIKFAKISLNKNYIGSYPLALVASRLILPNFEENEYLQRQVIAFKDDNDPDPDSNLFFSQAYFYLSQTVLLQDHFDESRLLLHQALDLLKNIPNTENYRKWYSCYFERIDCLEISYRIWMNEIRQEYEDNLKSLGPTHYEVIRAAEWLKENDPEWFTAFVRLQEQSKVPINIDNLSDVRKYEENIHNSFLIANQNITPLFDESSIRHLISKLAFSMWTPVGQESKSIGRQEIDNILRLGSKLDTFLGICQKMNLLRCDANYKFIFLDVNLRNYLAVPEIITFLGRDYMDMPGFRERAVNTLVKIGSIAVPSLLNALLHEQSEVNLGAAVALRKIGSPAVPSLLKALHHPYPKVRQMVIEALSSYENANMALQECICITG